MPFKLYAQTIAPLSVLRKRLLSFTLAVRLCMSAPPIRRDPAKQETKCIEAQSNQNLIETTRRWVRRKCYVTLIVKWASKLQMSAPHPTEQRESLALLARLSTGVSPMEKAACEKNLLEPLSSQHEVQILSNTLSPITDYAGPKKRVF